MTPESLTARVTDVDETPTVDATVPVEQPETAPAAHTRPWSALVCGLPGDGTLVVVDWLMLGCRDAGLVAQATPVGGSPDRPHGMYIEVALGDETELQLGDLPRGAVDLLVAGEHLELVRAIAHGYCDAERTTIIASCARAFTPAEHAVAGERVLGERDIDALATASAARYVAFHGPEVASWYRLPPAVQPALLFGAICGAGVTGLDVDACRDAIVRLDVDARRNVRAFDLGLRMGRRSGGRVRRRLTASQFVRKRRGALPRRERAGFEQLIERIDQQFDPEHRAVLREAVYRLTDFQSAAYAEQLVEWCVAVAREEDAVFAPGELRVDPARSIVPRVARSLATMLAYPDLAHVAHVKSRRKRLPELRKRHGINRNDSYSVIDHVVVTRAERAQARPAAIAKALSGSGPAGASPLLDQHRVVSIDATSVRGALQLRRWRNARRRRLESQAHALEFDAAHAYVSAVRETIATGSRELTVVVADSGALVQGAGVVRAATRTGALAFWGRIVRPALAIDRTAGDTSWSLASYVVPWAYRQVCRSGQLALWECSGQLLALAMAASRGASHHECIELAKQICRERAITDLATSVVASDVHVIGGDAGADELDAGNAAAEVEAGAASHDEALAAPAEDQ